MARIAGVDLPRDKRVEIGLTYICVDACPIRLIPSRLADHAEHHAEEAFVKLEGLECIECGSCSYVCPARRQLKQSIGSMKKIAMANLRKKK